MKKISWIIVSIIIFAGCSSSQDNPNIVQQKYVLGYNEPIRGVWLTNVASEALYSKENIVKAVDKCKELGINTIFTVTWNKAMTQYPSEIMEEFTGIKIEPILDPENTGRDPLAELIEEAHKQNIKVFAWFEFGFSSSYRLNGGKIVELKPEWASLNNKGELTTKNGFDWLNALDKDVQAFITSLILEVVENYNVDGIQGDDRLPAMPSSGGYNPQVIEQYKKEHFGQAPPEYYKDFEWVNWRSEKLNKFLKTLYSKVKETDSTCIVSMAPSVFPWSKEEYLQDWPSWINNGYVDMICPQVYRKDSAFYKSTLEATVQYIIPEKRHLLYPGLLIKAGSYMPSEDLLKYMIDVNRENEIEGEVFFFFEGLNKYEQILKELNKK